MSEQPSTKTGDDPHESPEPDEVSAGPEDDRPMSFWDHLTELRLRLFRAVMALLLGCVASWSFRTQLIEFLSRPLHVAWKQAEMAGQPDLQVLAIQSPLMVDVRVALLAGLFLALPVIFYQIWLFVSPGLYRHEKRFAIPFVVTSIAMFCIGATFAYVYVLPYGYRWLLEYGGGSYSVQLELGNYIKGTGRLIIAFGSVFEFPLAIAFLAKVGVVRHTSLLAHWRVSMLVIAIMSAMLTPPEPVTMLMMAAPMVLLFFASVVVAYFLQPKLDPELEASLAEAGRDTPD